MLMATVTGRLMITGFSAVGSRMSSTALQTSSAYSGSVPVKLSGLYSKRKLPSYLGRELLDERRAVRGDLPDLLLRFFKHLLALRHAGGVVEMHHRAGRALEGVEGSADDMLAALGEHLHRHVVRDEVLFDERAQKFVLRLAGGGEPDLDLLEAQLDEKT